MFKCLKMAILYPAIMNAEEVHASR